MKFAMSYICGKDSTLALHKMMEQGHEPICLIVMVNESVGRSYFHGADAACFGDIDICGENGEYHTLAVDGPVFHKPLVFKTGDKIKLGNYAVIDIK